MRSAQKGDAWLHVKDDPMGNRVWMDSSIRGTKRFIVDIVGGLPVILCEVDQANGSLEKSYIHADGQPKVGWAVPTRSFRAGRAEIVPGPRGGHTPGWGGLCPRGLFGPGVQTSCPDPRGGHAPG